jgi:hypothetical protein
MNTTARIVPWQQRKKPDLFDMPFIRSVRTANALRSCG